MARFMGANLLVGWKCDISSAVTHGSSNHTRHLAKNVFGSPEATSTETCQLVAILGLEVCGAEFANLTRIRTDLHFGEARFRPRGRHGASHDGQHGPNPCS